MSTTTHFEISTAGHGSGTRTTTVTNLAGRVAAWWSARRAARDLDRFSDAMLKDIGLTRGDIHSAVRGERPHRHDGLRHHNPFTSPDNYR